MNLSLKFFYRVLPLYTGLFILASLLLVSSGCDRTETEPEEGVYAITDVTVIPMDREEVLERHTVIIRDGRIMEVGPSDQTSLPAGAEQIDGSGKYLIPGLAEMHGHIPGPDNPQYAEDVLFLYISNGVTTVRNMAGHPYHLELRERIDRGELPGPAIFAAGPWLGGNISGPEDADRVVREQAAAGFDLLKLGSISLDSYRQMAETARETGIPFGGHIPASVGLEVALEEGQASIDHLDRYVEFLAQESSGGGFFGSGLVDQADLGRIPEAVERTIEAGTWNVPTLSLVEHLASPEPAEEMAEWPEMRYMPANVVEGWVESKHNYQAREDFQPDATQELVRIRQQLTKALNDAGAPIALGSDAPQFFNVPGFSIHHELVMMVAAGLTPYEVLVTGTRNPAHYFNTPEEFGTIESGKRADLILLRSNPLEDISHVRERDGVMVRGVWYPEDEIEERLEQIAERVTEQ